MTKRIIDDLKYFYGEFNHLKFGAKMVALYLVLSYMRPQAIIPALDFLPWTQLAILAGLSWAISQNNLRLDKSFSSTLFFALICTLSAFSSEYADYSTSKLNTIFTWLVEIVFFVSCIRTKREFHFNLILLFIIFFKITLFGARTWAQRGFAFKDYGIAGPPGFFANSGELSLIVAMITIWSATYLYSRKAPLVYYILPLTGVMTVLAASSRGGQLALLAGFVWFFLISGKLKLKYIILFSFALFLSFHFLPEKQKERFTSAGEDSTSTSRLLYWGKGLEMANKHPWLGVGYYSFPLYFHDYYSSELPEEMAWSKRKEVAHNSFIEVLSGTGYIGLILYLYLHFLIYLNSRRYGKLVKLQNPAYSPFAKGLSAGLICYIVGSFFMSVAFYPYVYLMLMLTSSALFSESQPPEETL